MRWGNKKMYSVGGLCNEAVVNAELSVLDHVAVSNPIEIVTIANGYSCGRLRLALLCRTTGFAPKIPPRRDGREYHRRANKEGRRGKHGTNGRLHYKLFRIYLR